AIQRIHIVQAVGAESKIRNSWNPEWGYAEPVHQSLYMATFQRLAGSLDGLPRLKGCVVGKQGELINQLVCRPPEHLWKSFRKALEAPLQIDAGNYESVAE